MRVLDRGDLPAAIRVLSTNPVENVFVASRVRAAGLEQASLGCPVWGYERDGVLRALCHAGSNLVPVNADAGRDRGLDRVRRAATDVRLDHRPVDGRARTCGAGCPDRWGLGWARGARTSGRTSR